MKAILTRTLPATDTKPTRIKAYDEDGNSITVPGDGNVHMDAACMLRDKMGWTGQLMGGTTKDGAAFVFVDAKAKQT